MTSEAHAQPRAQSAIGEPSPKKRKKVRSGPQAGAGEARPLFFDMLEQQQRGGCGDIDLELDYFQRKLGIKTTAAAAAQRPDAESRGEGKKSAQTSAKNLAKVKALLDIDGLGDIFGFVVRRALSWSAGLLFRPLCSVLGRFREEQRRLVEANHIQTAHFFRARR